MSKPAVLGAALVAAAAIFAAPAVTAAETAPATAPADALFVPLKPDEAVVQKVHGMSVENPANEHLGSIRRVAYLGPAVKAYVLEASGHWVAVSPNAVTFKYDAPTTTWHAFMNAEPAQIKGGPAYMTDTEE